MKSLFFFIWLTKVALYSPSAVQQMIDKHPAMKLCSHTRIELGKSHKGKPILAWYIPGKQKGIVYLWGSIHGNEKAGAVLATNLILNLCAASNKQEWGALIVPIANPDGFSRKAWGRGNGRFHDLNRDAFNRAEKESKALYRGFHFKIVRFIDVHMYGHHLQWPRPWTRAFKASQRFQKRLKGLGLKWWARSGYPYGMWFSMASELGIPSVLFEIGRRGDHLKHGRLHYYRLVRKPLRTIFRLFFEKKLPMPKDLRRGSRLNRIKKYEKRKWKRKDKGLRRHLRRILPKSALIPSGVPSHLRDFYIEQFYRHWRCKKPTNWLNFICKHA